jgi:hypothetical protein
MAQQAPTKIIVDPSLVERADIHCPTYMPRTVFLNVLIQEGLDKRSTLREQPGRAAYISSSLELDNKEEDVFLKEAKTFSAAVKAKNSEHPQFEAFWKVYQSCPAPTLRVRSQTKPKAKEAFQEALKLSPAADIVKAARIAVEGQLDSQSSEEWCPALPDAARWLKEARFVALLEDHAPAQVKRLTEEEEQAQKDAIAAEAHARIFGR